MTPIILHISFAPRFTFAFVKFEVFCLKLKKALTGVIPMTRFACAAFLSLVSLAPIAGAQTSSTAQSIYEVPVKPMGNETTTTLAKYKGDVMLIVNVASKCGFTPQYKALEELNKKYSPQGLKVLGFPSNDFGNQEPGTEQEIIQFCESKYGVTFPLYAKVHAKGENKSPIYRYLTEHSTEDPGEVKWNFEKFLISRDGQIVQRFRSKITPDSKELTSAVEKELSRKQIAK
jgi:glutathione peroxidase